MDGIVWGAMTRSEESCTLGKPLRAGTYLRERGNENGADRPVETLAPASVRGVRRRCTGQWKTSCRLRALEEKGTWLVEQDRVDAAVKELTK